MLAAIEEVAAEEGYWKLLVEMYQHQNFEKARRFYESNGLRKTGRIADHLSDGSAMVVYAQTTG